MIKAFFKSIMNEVFLAEQEFEKMAMNGNMSGIKMEKNF
jgi:hypothetical protein